MVQDEQSLIHNNFKVKQIKESETCPCTSLVHVIYDQFDHLLQKAIHNSVPTFVTKGIT
jgi:hypothetical protein